MIISESNQTNSPICLTIDLAISNFMINSLLIDHIKKTLETSLTTVDIIIIKGSEDVFCKGMDLEGIINSKTSLVKFQELLISFKNLMTLLANCPIPIIASVNGNIYGGGLGLACVADVIIMADHVEISLPEVLMGLIPAMIFPYLTRRLPVAKAKALTISAKPIKAEEAFNLGIADEITTNMQKSLKRYITRLSHIDKNACAEFKALYNKHFGVQEIAYFEDAMPALSKLLENENTLKRLNVFLQGSSPW